MVKGVHAAKTVPFSLSFLLLCNENLSVNGITNRAIEKKIELQDFRSLTVRYYTAWGR